MKNILLTGVGNALVDLEYSITDIELDNFGVTKGSMALTDSVRQSEMIAALGQRKAHRSSGGSAANSIIAFAQFGGSAAYCSLLGADHFGDFYASEFKDLGIVLAAEQVKGATTGSCLVLITPDGERTLNTTLAVNTEFSRSSISEELIKASEWLYIEGYKLTDDNGAEAVDHALFYARKHGTHVAVSCSDGFIIQWGVGFACFVHCRQKLVRESAIALGERVRYAFDVCGCVVNAHAVDANKING